VVLLAAVSLLLALPVEAQEETSPPPTETLTHPTALESYLERPGILLVKRLHRLGPVALRGGGEIRLDAIGAHEPGMQHQRVMGIRIEVDAPGLTDRERVFFLDLHEIEELVRAIDFMMGEMDKAQSDREDDSTEVSISTQDEFEVGVRFASGGPRPFLRTPEASLAIRRAALEALRTHLNQGRKRLFSD
jgi:hypothetical protein